MTTTDRRNGENGDVAVIELVLAVPLFLVLLLTMVALGRLATSRLDIDDVAADAARAASLARSPEEAIATAQAKATAALGGHDLTCEPLAVRVDVTRFRPGGWVAVEVDCTVPGSELGLDRVSPDRGLSGRAVAPIEVHRGLR